MAKKAAKKAARKPRAPKANPGINNNGPEEETHSRNSRQKNAPDLSKVSPEEFYEGFLNGKLSNTQPVSDSHIRIKHENGHFYHLDLTRDEIPDHVRAKIMEMIEEVNNA